MRTRSPHHATTPYQITVRFGDAILQAGFTAVPNLVLDHYASLGITPGEMIFIIHVWQYWWTEQDPYPSLKTIAGKMQEALSDLAAYKGLMPGTAALKARLGADVMAAEIEKAYFAACRK